MNNGQIHSTEEMAVFNEYREGRVTRESGAASVRRTCTGRVPTDASERGINCVKKAFDNAMFIPYACALRMWLKLSQKFPQQPPVVVLATLTAEIIWRSSRGQMPPAVFCE